MQAMKIDASEIYNVADWIKGTAIPNIDDLIKQIEKNKAPIIDAWTTDDGIACMNSMEQNIVKFQQNEQVLENLAAALRRIAARIESGTQRGVAKARNFTDVGREEMIQ